jgi:hypothetical protein
VRLRYLDHLLLVVVGTGGCCNWYEMNSTIAADGRHKAKAGPSRTCKVVSSISKVPVPVKSARIGKSA